MLMFHSSANVYQRVHVLRRLWAGTWRTWPPFMPRQEPEQDDPDAEAKERVRLQRCHRNAIGSGFDAPNRRGISKRTEDMGSVAGNCANDKNDGIGECFLDIFLLVGLELVHDMLSSLVLIHINNIYILYIYICFYYWFFTLSNHQKPKNLGT